MRYPTRRLPRASQALIGAVLALSLGSPGGAAPITVFFEGTIDFVDEEVVNAPIEVGSVIRGSYHLDPSAPMIGSSGSSAVYSIEPGPFTISVGSSDLDIAPGSHLIVDNDVVHGVDQWAFRFSIQNDLIDARFCYFVLRDFTGSILDSSDLIIPTSLSGWTGAMLRCLRDNPLPIPNSTAFEGTVNRMFVPEPRGAVLLSLGLLALGVVRRPRTR